MKLISGRVDLGNPVAQGTVQQVSVISRNPACHNCLFLPETSCERGNRYLDRSVLVPTMERAEFAFFLP
jgi:hypothetical protein